MSETKIHVIERDDAIDELLLRRAIAGREIAIALVDQMIDDLAERMEIEKLEDE